MNRGDRYTDKPKMTEGSRRMDMAGRKGARLVSGQSDVSNGV